MPTVFIKMRPYLKEFIMNLENRDGEKLYPKEPVRFSMKERLGLLIDRMRRKPGPKNVVICPATKEERKCFLEVDIDIDPMVKNDAERIFLSNDAQAHISKYIYNVFCATLFEYVEYHMRCQRETLAGFTPVRKAAYRDFCLQYNLDSATEDSLRKAYDRQNAISLSEQSRKKVHEVRNNWLFWANNKPFSTQIDI